MNTITLKPTAKREGYGGRKSTFVVEYKDKTEHVNMFKFQEREELPESIVCFENGFGRLVQSNQALFDRYYESRQHLYLFKIKYKWSNYYELEDPRPEVGDDYKPRLLFSKSTPDLEKGDLVRCEIEEIRDGQLYLLLKDKNPSRLSFHSFEDIFHVSEHGALEGWLQRQLESSPMDEVRQLYQAHDGKWLFVFSTMMPRLFYALLEEERTDKAALLQQFCEGWLAAVEHSSFIEEMGEGDFHRYGKNLHASIELCEDVLAALHVSDKENALLRDIASLNPHYYQYRPAKRLRFLACVAALQPAMLAAHIQPLLDQLQAIGEEKCCSAPMAQPLAFILGCYVRHAVRHYEHMLSYDGATLSPLIKRCATALCYLVRILHSTGSSETMMYVSRLYQLLTLRPKVTAEEKKALLRNAYRALFSGDTPLHGYKWDEMAAIVNERSYRFSRDTVSAASHFSYDAGTTRATLSPTGIMLTTASANASPKSFDIMDEIAVTLPAERSMAGLSREQDFQLIQQTWNEVEASLAVAVAPRLKKAGGLLSGDEVQIYITDIVDRETAKCKIVGSDEEYAIPFKHLFYYPKPKVSMADFMGSDGAPLLFPAVYRSYNGTMVTFDTVRYKVEFAAERLPFDHIVSAFLFSVTPESCLAVTADGFVVSFNPHGATLQDRTFVDITITERDSRGRVTGIYEGPTEEAHRFDNRKCYTNYIREFNRFHNGGRETTKATSDAMSEDATLLVNGRHLQMVVDIVALYARQLRDARERYCYLSLCNVLTRLLGDGNEQQRMALRLKYTELLYRFSANHTLGNDEVQAFLDRTKHCEPLSEMGERRRVIVILSRYGNALYDNCIDNEMVQLIKHVNSTPLEKELARLVVAGHLLAEFDNLDEHLLDEMGARLGLDIIKPTYVNLGVEESSTVEFKSSLVYPPNNGGNEDEEQQGDNLLRVVRAMMRADGGTLYIGVNDKGDIVGLQSDFAYFAKKATYDGSNAKDLFRNHFSCLLANGLGAAVAATLSFDFEEKEGCTYFRVTIPQNAQIESSYIRIGSTNQRI